jgi:hypothetical protein
MLIQHPPTTHHPIKRRFDLVDILTHRILDHREFVTISEAEAHWNSSYSSGVYVVRDTYDNHQTILIVKEKGGKTPKF